MCRDGAGGGWGKVLRWTDKANITHEQIVPQRMLPRRVESGDQIAAMLEHEGLDCSANPALLKKFVMEVDATDILTTVETTGWHAAGENRFVYTMADGTVFGRADHRIILKPDLVSLG